MKCPVCGTVEGLRIISFLPRTQSIVVPGGQEQRIYLEKTTQYPAISKGNLYQCLGCDYAIVTMDQEFGIPPEFVEDEAWPEDTRIDYQTL